jgi:hypothetical protein
MTEEYQITRIDWFETFDTGIQVNSCVASYDQPKRVKFKILTTDGASMYDTAKRKIADLPFDAYEQSDSHPKIWSHILHRSTVA